MAPTSSSLRTPLQRVLVPTDFTEGAEAALDRALLLPLTPGARLHLVHVLPPEVPARLRSAAEEHARTTLEYELARARRATGARADVEATLEVLHGPPFVELVRAARRTEAELVVLGRHGRRPVRDMFVGSTAERVVRKGEAPVLVVRARPEGPYVRPLVASDLEEGSRAALELVLRLLAAHHESLAVVHVYGMPFEGLLPPMSASRALAGGPRQAFEEEALRALLAQLAPYAEAGLGLRPAVRCGDARALLVEEATRGRHDVVALGTHGRAGVAHALLGSVAAWVMGAAPCDVLVARTPGVTVAKP